MSSFLEHVAADLLRKYGNDLSRLVVVFPNKRASLFLNAHLSRFSESPIWSPRYMTISELFRQQSTLTVADPIKLVCELHKSFTAQTGIDETLDHFYGWGQLLLSDFDDLDKNMADADRVLANLRDIHELDGTDYLSDEQKEAIAKFFSNFSPDHNSLLKERFLRLWSRMAAIYHDFNDRLNRQQLAYEGALYRSVVENLEKPDREDTPLSSPSSLLSPHSSTPPSPSSLLSPHSSLLYIFVGFNVLQKVEQRLFLWLKREGKARFYWDYDKYYMQSEAGMFIRENLADFPNELDGDNDDIFSCFARQKTITVASAPTENIQARYAATWLGKDSAPGPDTAIVLCDESLLPTVIHCLPDNVNLVNVTTGYPLGQAPVAALINALFALRTQGYQPGRDRYRLRHVNALLRHPYIAGLSPLIADLHRDLNEKKIYYPSTALLTACESPAIVPGGSPAGTAFCSPALLFRPLPSEGGNAALLSWMCDVLKAIAATVPPVSPTGQAIAPPPSPSGQVTTSPSSPTSPQPFSIQTESLFRAYTLLNRLLSLVTAGDLAVDVITLQRLVAQLMQTTTIPFHGEPVEGLQVMGLLETRNLDFRHVLLLSTNEGNIPRGVSDTSFIPYSIRKAYALTTTEHKVAIYSYYFHRLLQRADDVTIVYNNSTSDGHTGEMSRFVLQLMVEDSHHNIAMKTLQASQAFTPFHPQPVEKTPQMMQKLQARFSTTTATVPVASTAGQTPVPATSPAGQAPLLTPTAINRYQRCPLMFYYTYVHDLREPDTNDDDTIDNRIFGNIFHEAARIVYSRLMEKSRLIIASNIDHLLHQRIDIDRAVDEAIRKELFHLEDTEADASSHGGAHTAQRSQSPTLHPDLSGLQIINREVIIHYLRQLLTIDRQLAPFTIIGLETDVAMPLETENIKTIVGGRIDRLDMITTDKGERIRVIDYKTGSRVPTPLSGPDAIFQQEQLDNHSDYYLQTFLYSIIVAEDASAQRVPYTEPLAQSAQPATPTTAVSPALLFIQHAGVKDYNPVLKFGKENIDDVAPYAPLFMHLLMETVDEMFSPDVPFIPTSDRNRCRSCPYRMLCF